MHELPGKSKVLQPFGDMTQFSPPLKELDHGHVPHPRGRDVLFSFLLTGETKDERTIMRLDTGVIRRSTPLVPWTASVFDAAIKGPNTSWNHRLRFL